jgi:hypothetical protein
MPRNSFKPTHGHRLGGRRSPTYRSWENMMARCYRRSAGGFEFYGGRGIVVCERWKKFEGFLADMGERPEGATLDRFPDQDGNYEPGNCRWADVRAQNRNRRGTVFITIDGRTQCALDWSRENGISYAAVVSRLHQGWAPARAVTEPLQLRWADAEDFVIRAFWPMEGASMAGRLPDRTIEAIRQRARTLGVRNVHRMRAL